MTTVIAIAIASAEAGVLLTVLGVFIWTHIKGTK